MKYVISQGYGSLDLRAFMGTIEDENPDVLISMGDFTDPGTVKQFILLEDGLEANGKEVINVPSLRDIAVYAMPFAIPEISEKLRRDLTVNEYLGSIVDQSAEKSIYIDHPAIHPPRRAFIAHGGYNHNNMIWALCDTPNFASATPISGTTMSILRNLKSMKIEGIEFVILSGIPFDLVSSPRGIEPTEEKVRYESINDEKINLPRDEYHIISAGSLSSGEGILLLETEGENVSIRRRY